MHSPNTRTTLSEIFENIDSLSVLENLNEGLLLVDTNDIIQFANLRYCELTGYSLQEMSGKKAHQLLKVENPTFPVDRLLKNKAKDANYVYEVEITTKRSEKKWFRVSGNSIKDAKDNNIGNIEVHIEITDQKLAENLLKESENRFRNLADSTPVLIWMADSDNDFFYFNKAWLNFSGRELEREVGRGWMDNLPREESAHFMEKLRKLMDLQKPFEIEHKMRRSDGEYREILTIGSPRYLPDKRFAGFIGSSVDISNVKNIAHELAHQTQELRRSNAELEQFAYVASHDLQEPLRMISSYIQIIHQKLSSKGEEEMDDYMHYTIDGVRRMQNLINDLLNYSRVNSLGKPFEEVDLNNIVKVCKSNLQTLLEETSAEIKCVNLPTLRADKSQMMRLFQNLIENAIKFKSEKPPLIEIKCKKENSDHVFEILDNGIGIEDKYYDRIFAIFQRLHSRKDYKGTGIGLAICKKIVERHGGRIWVKSVPEKGTKFSFTIKSDL